MITNTLWVEKYRPQTFDEYVGDNTFKEKAKTWIANQEIKNLLLHGPSGTGKTTAAKIFMKAIDSDYIVVNASDENGVEIVRNKIKNFVSTVGFSKWKFVLLDECLTGDTLVNVLRADEEQLIPIHLLDPSSDKIVSRDLSSPNLDKIYQDFVLKNNGFRKVLRITFENGEVIQCTDRHKWFIPAENGKIEVTYAENLNVGSNILTIRHRSNALTELSVVDIEQLESYFTVFDIGLEKHHNFFVGQTGTMTHNCDLLSFESQGALRNLIESSSEHCRFIFTCNYPEKIIPAIKSRTTEVQIIPPSMKDCALRLVEILTKENVEFEIADIKKILDNTYPDMRKSIEVLQDCSITGKLVLDSNAIQTSEYAIQVLNELISNNSPKDIFKNVRQIFADSKIRSFDDMYRYFYDNIEKFPDGTQSLVILHIAEASFRSSLVIDKEITAAELILKIIQEIKG